MKPTLINLEAERAARAKTTRSQLDEVRATLRALPVSERGEAIVAMFALVTAEFAQMVLDHSPTPPRGKGKRYAGRVIKRSAKIVGGVKRQSHDRGKAKSP